MNIILNIIVPEQTKITIYVRMIENNIFIYSSTKVLHVMTSETDRCVFHVCLHGGPLMVGLILPCSMFCTLIW